MENKKQRTVDILKAKTEVSENVKIRVKEFVKIKKTIKSVLKSEPKTIPEIVKETNIEASEITYSLMSMMKYGDIIADRVDDDDEYYYYKLKGEQ